MARMASAIKCNAESLQRGLAFVRFFDFACLADRWTLASVLVTEVNIDKAMEDAARLCTSWVRQRLQDGTEITRKHKKDNLLAYKTAFAENKLKLVVPGSNLSLVKIEK
jgi:hypothetical protein